MSPRVEVSREHVIIQSVGVAILLDRDRLRCADQQTVSQLLAELGETSFETWQREIADSPLGDDRLTATAADGSEDA